MKNAAYLVFIVALFLSCTKSNTSNSGVAALNIINAAVDVPSVAVYFSDTTVPYYQNEAPVYYGGYAEYGINPGMNSVSVVPSTDTLKSIFKGSFNVKAGAVYSLYVIGQGVPFDTLFMQDALPIRKDITAGARFINLSPDSPPLSINLEGNPPEQPEIDELTYKQISDFKSYSGKDGITNYNFEIRNKATGELLTTFYWNFIVYKNYTLVISGSADPSASTPISVFQVNNF